MWQAAAEHSASGDANAVSTVRLRLKLRCLRDTLSLLRLAPQSSVVGRRRQSEYAPKTLWSDRNW